MPQFILFTKLQIDGMGTNMYKYINNFNLLEMDKIHADF